MFTTPKLRFRLRFVDEPDENGGGSSNDTPPEEPKADKYGDLGFPANTPWKEMTPEQQANYWRDKAKKHEKRARPADFDKIVEDAQKWRAHKDENQTPDERALNDARNAGRQEGVSMLLHDAIRAELRAARPHMTTEDLDEFLEDVALDRFLGEDGRLDTDRVTRLADKLAVPDKQDDDTSSGQPNGGVALGLVLNRTTPPAKGGTGSVDEYRQKEADRYKTKSTK